MEKSGKLSNNVSQMSLSIVVDSTDPIMTQIIELKELMRIATAFYRLIFHSFVIQEMV